MAEAAGFRGRFSSPSPLSPSGFPFLEAECSAREGPSLGSLVLSLQPLRLLLQDGRMVNLMGSAAKAPGAEGLEASNSLEVCRVSDEENLGFGSLPNKFVAFSSSLDFPVTRFEKEIGSIERIMELRLLGERRSRLWLLIWRGRSES